MGAYNRRSRMGQRTSDSTAEVYLAATMIVGVMAVVLMVALWLMPA